MTFDITVKHPAYLEFRASWQLMRDAVDGEDAIKGKGEAYLPMKSGTRAIESSTIRDAAYEAYKTRAEFPELVAPTVRGTVGVMLEQAATIKLPSALESLRERATRDGMPLDVLHRRIATELMETGRYGLLPGILSSGTPYLAGYCAESIINWDSTDDVPDYVVLDESGDVRNRETGAWTRVEQYRECYIDNGAYAAREWTNEAGASTFAPKQAILALKPPKGGRTEALGALPFVFINTNGLGADPDDVPLYGLAKLAVRIYRLDADYVFAMHMTSEPTPVAMGFDNPDEAKKKGLAPSSIGASKLWLLPKGGDAKFLEFSGAGIAAQKDAIAAAMDRAVALGAQILSDSGKTAESGDALKLRLGNQSSVLKLVAMTSAAGLERSLKNIAVWIGANPDEVKVEPVTDFFDRTLSAQEITAIVSGWQSSAYSWRTAFDRLQKGGVIPVERTAEEEQEYIAIDQEGRDPSPEEMFDPATGKPIDPTTLPKQISQPTDI
jgi:hypothetical protein